MKKTLIASACAFTLCFTSCATKQAPAKEEEPQAPFTQAEEPSETATAENKTEQNQNKETSSTETEENKFELDIPDLTINSEDFPALDIIDEPEIVTLEPEELTEPLETEEIPVTVEEEPLLAAETEPELIETENQNAQEEKPEADELQNVNEESNNIEVTTSSDSDDDGITAIGGGIDITDDDAANESKYNENTKNIVPSRSVTIKKFEYLEVTYPGTGWIYMGLIDNSKDIAYFGRKLGTKDTKFTLQARASGTKIVHFYRNDPLTGKYLDDYLEITILAENGSNKTHVDAPEYKLPVQKKETPVTQEETEEQTEDAEQSATTPSKSAEAKTTANTNTKASNDSAAKTNTSTANTTKTTPTSTASTKSASTIAETKASETYEETTTADASTQTSVSVSDSSTLLKEAQLLYNEKEYAAALKKLNQFFEYSTDSRDEALYLKGQILEAKSDVRDIKGAIDAYTSLTKNYPASKLWDSANKRIIYLKRFYLEVR